MLPTTSNFSLGDEVPNPTNWYFSHTYKELAFSFHALGSALLPVQVKILLLPSPPSPPPTLSLIKHISKFPSSVNDSLSAFTIYFCPTVNCSIRIRGSSGG